MAEKTDLGRLAGPSLLRLVDEAMSINGSQSLMSGQLSAEIWDNLDQMLEVNVILILYNGSFATNPIYLCIGFLCCREDLLHSQTPKNLVVS